MPNTTNTDALAHYATAIGHLLFFIGGTLITLLVSIFDVSRRTALKLFAGCVFGGIGAVLAGIATESWGGAWTYACAGAAAVVAENIVLGLVKASKDFSENPFRVIIDFFKQVIPAIPGFSRRAD